MSGLLARETADAERRASRKRSRLIKTLIERADCAQGPAVIDLTTFREKRGGAWLSVRVRPSNVSLGQ
jgi:hypothetical protein